MEDLATLEISRAQIWQWLRHAVVLDDGTEVTPEFVRGVFAEELHKVLQEVEAAIADSPAADRDAQVESFVTAKEDAERIFLEPSFRPFLSNASDLFRG